MSDPTVDSPPTAPTPSRPAPTPRQRLRERFRREERHEIRYHLSIAIAVCFSWFFWLMPARAREWICVHGGDYFYRRAKTYRTDVLANLRQVLPEASEESLNLAARNIFRTSARNFMDLVRVPRISRQAFIDNVELVRGDWSMLDEGLARGKGLILLSAHLGAFDYIGQTVHARGYKLTTVTVRTTSRFIFDGVIYLRRSNDNEMVEATPSGVRKTIQALRRGEVAVLITDRDFFQNGTPVEFFGRETTLPPGAVRMARDTGAAVVALFARRTENGYGMTLEGPFTIEKTADREADVRRGVEFVAGLLERAIRETPDQWVMFQRAWPEEPAAPLRVFPAGSPLESELLERVAAALPGPRRPKTSPDDRPPSTPADTPTDRTDPPRQSPA